MSFSSPALASIDRWYRCQRPYRAGRRCDFEEVDLEIIDASLLEQTFGVFARPGDVAAVTGQGFELASGEGKLIARPREAADKFHERDLGHGRRAAPAIDGHCQGLAYTDVVSRLLARIDSQHQACRPRSLDRDGVVLELVCDLVSVAGVRPRNSTSNCPPMIPVASPVDFTKKALKPSRYGRPGWKYPSNRLPSQLWPMTCSTKLKAPVPKILVSG